MAQANTITVNDRETTPVAHNFVPRRIEPGNATFVEAASVPIGEKTLTISLRKSGKRFYVRVKMYAPVLVNELINGVSVPNTPRTALADCQFRFDDTSTEQERMNLVGMFANAFAANQAIVLGSVTKLEGIY